LDTMIQEKGGIGTMIKLTRKLWLALPILVAVALVSAPVFLFNTVRTTVSSGWMLLIGLQGILVSTLKSVLSKSETSLIVKRSKRDGKFTLSFDSGQLKRVIYHKPAGAESESKEDEKLIIEYIGQLLGMAQEERREKPFDAGAISEEDKKTIVKMTIDYIHMLLEMCRDEVDGKPSQIGPITEADKQLIVRLTMDYIDDLLEAGWTEGETVSEVGPISEEDKRLIVRLVTDYIDELLENQKECSEETSGVGKIVEEDKKFIIDHIDDLMRMAQKDYGEEPYSVESISEEDKRMIIKHIDELLQVTRKESKEKSN